MLMRRIFGGGLGKPCKQGGFSKVQFFDGLTEIIFSGHCHPIGSVSQINLIKIKVENLFLGKIFFNFKGQDGLTYLSF
jgi:hypothetical protein